MTFRCQQAGENAADSKRLKNFDENHGTLRGIIYFTAQITFLWHCGKSVFMSRVNVEAIFPGTVLVYAYFLGKLISKSPLGSKVLQFGWQTWSPYF